MDKVKMGLIGVGSRGKGMLISVMSMSDVEIVAVCDAYEDRTKAAANYVEGVYSKRPFETTDYREMLKLEELDAVMICTAWESHIPIAINAMKAKKAVCMEVGGAYSLDDCFEMVRVQEKTGTPFMLLENCCFDKTELLITNLVRHGKFGEVVHCSGAYGHDLRKEITDGNRIRHYRLRNYIHRNCENYPTHELGPIAKILGINRGNRMVSLVSMASKAAGLESYIEDRKDTIDPELIGQKFNQGDIVTTIIKCANGETIQLRLDTTLPRVYDRDFTVHGTKAYSRNKTAVFDSQGEKYVSLTDEQYMSYLPSCWTDMTEEGKRLGHGGMDGIEIRVFLDCLKNGKPMPIDVYDAAAWMCISCLTEISIAQGGMPQAIPDFTHGEWMSRPLEDVVELPRVED